MKILAKAAEAVRRGAEGFPGLVPRTSQAWSKFFTPGSSFDWGKYTGNLYDCGPVAIGVQFAWRNWPYSRIVVQEKKDNRWVEIEHELTSSLLDPNPFYDSSALWAASYLSDTVGGNCYWGEARRRDGRVAWVYLPHTQVTPVTAGGKWIDRYDYQQPGGDVLALDPAAVVHFRNGLDPQDQRLGLSPLSSLYREVAGDNLASTYSAAILRRMGVPGVIINPKTTETVAPTAAQSERIKQLYTDNFTSDGAGGAMVAPVPVDLTFPDASPERLAIKSLRDVPTSRILAAMGYDPGALGLPSETSKHHANYDAMLKAAWEQGLVPVQIRFARVLTHRYLYESKGRLRVWWDWSDVPAFAEDEAKVADTAGKLFKNGVVKRSEARSMVGQASEASDEVYVEEATMGGDPALKQLAKAAGERASQRRKLLEDAGLAPGTDD